MAKKMLIDATHPEETRVVVVDGTKVDDFDYESINKRQLAGNIYLAKVTRVEPSLQAAFVDYGGNRHGFLAFAEVHPDYYQIPVADREALLAEEAAAEEAERAQNARNDARADRGERPERGERPDRGERLERAPRERAEPDAEATPDVETLDDDGKTRRPRRTRRRRGAKTPDAASVPGLEVIDQDEDEDRDDDADSSTIKGLEISDIGDEADFLETGDDPIAQARSTGADRTGRPARPRPVQPAEAPADPDATGSETAAPEAASDPVDLAAEPFEPPTAGAWDAPHPAALPQDAPVADADPVSPETADTDTAPENDPDAPPRTLAEGAGLDEAETVAEDVAETPREDEPGPAKSGDSDPDMEVESVGAEDLQAEVSAVRARRRRHYKIQDVLKVRQIMLVQVVKEERGNKGAALTTYLSLAGRYCVLMPNTARGGGISRKITQAGDRKRLRDIIGELEVPRGMGLIVRTAGAERTRAEIHRDYEFLIRQWEQVRELTLKSIAPTLIYEEGSLIKRSIRDLYSSEIDTILVEGEQGYREARDYMSMLMPPSVRHVQPYAEPVPLFIRYGVESYLNGMFNPTVQLKSGGYIVIGITEALVAIDVNSGRSTKEGSIEETALKTNLEAADEVARQLRLRDLAGLIVIDFIDMDEGRNNRAVEKRIKDRLKTDRARIQIGRISAFGLMEMSRQRLRPGMLEASTRPCPHCHGAGLIRSDESLALAILREVEEEGVRARSAEITVTLPVDIANYLINQKRSHLTRIEARYGLVITVLGDPGLASPNYKIEKSKIATRPVAVPDAVVTAESGASAVWAEVPEVEAPAAAPATAVPAPAPSGEREDKTEAGARRRRGKRGGKRRRGGVREDGTPMDAAQLAEAALAELADDDGATDETGRTDDADPDVTPPSPASAPGIEASSAEIAVEPAPGPETAAAPAPETEAAPPKRKRTRKAVPDAIPAAAPDAEAAPPPKRTRTRKKAAAPEETAAPAPEPVSAPEMAAPPVVEPRPDDTAAAIDPAAVAPSPAGTEVDAPPVPDPTKPKKRGWWALRR